MAYINARSKYGYPFSVSVEDKHRYYNGNEKTIPVYKENDQSNEGPGFCPFSSNFSYYNIGSEMKIAQGSADDERIGNKVYLKFVDITYGIFMQGDVLTTTFPHGTINDLFMRCRVMLVKFNKPMTSTDFAKWFQETYTYFRTVGVAGGGNKPLQSCHWNRLRESTEWTGNFKIIYDKKITLTRSKCMKFKDIHWTINRNTTYENTYNTATDDYLQNVYLLFIGPSCLRYDLDAISRDRVNAWTANYTNPLKVNMCMKYEYYDI